MTLWMGFLLRKKVVGTSSFPQSSSFVFFFGFLLFMKVVLWF